VRSGAPPLCPWHAVPRAPSLEFSLASDTARAEFRSYPPPGRPPRDAVWLYWQRPSRRQLHRSGRPSPAARRARAAVPTGFRVRSFLPPLTRELELGDLLMCVSSRSRLINVAPPAAKPDLDALARDDGPLFEQVFFGYMDKHEVKDGFRQLGSVNTEVLSLNKEPDESSQPLVWRF
jgi:hypothetical protein